MNRAFTRRDFLSHTTRVAGVAAAATIVPRNVLGGPRQIPPSEKMNVAGIGFGLAYPVSAPGIPLPNQLGVAPEGLGRGQLLRTVLGPQSRLGLAKRRDITLR